MFSNKSKLIASRCIAESINQLIAGHYSHVGLPQLHTKPCMQLMKAYVAKTSWNQLID